VSIWASVAGAGLDLIPVRDNYSGEIVADPTSGLGHIDVATASSWHDLIRLAIDGDGAMGRCFTTELPVAKVELLLTRDEARELARRLNEAVARASHEPALCSQFQDRVIIDYSPPTFCADCGAPSLVHDIENTDFDDRRNGIRRFLRTATLKCPNGPHEVTQASQEVAS
jgi:hypothetical protein